MTDVPAGWYPDPAAPHPGQPPTQRFWDGQDWTVHVAPIHGPYGVPPLVSRPTTPDGAPLASWLKRLGAYVIDSLVIGVASSILTLPVQISLQRRMQDLLAQLDTTGAQTPDFGELLRDYIDAFVPLLVWSVLATLVCWTLYSGLMLRLKNATLGKLALGLEVRLRERPGQLPWSAIGLRTLVQWGYLVTAVVPLLYLALSWYPYLDCLWPLWDQKRQALHDKAARTNVVEVRQSGV